jgi:GNAT superfamily N-acetyltransferase
MTIRPAGLGDYAAYVRLFGELAIPDPVPSAERFVTLAEQMRVACDDTGSVVGYVTWRPYGALAHVVQIAVDRERRGQRIGERLLEHVRGEARAAGCTRWYLNVKRGNTPALRLYERCGFAFELESVVVKLAWARLPRIEVRDELAMPTDDAAIAATFHLPVERIATFRARGSFRMVIVRDEASAIVGFAPFDPTFPGTPAFSAARPELAHAVLEAVRRHADPAFDFVRVTVEGDRPLVDAILALGAEPSFEILRLSAPV